MIYTYCVSSNSEANAQIPGRTMGHIWKRTTLKAVGGSGINYTW